MADLATYNPEEVSIVVAGLLSVKGFVDGTFVTITKDVMPFSSVTSADGVTARTYNSSQSYTVAITLYGGSESNDFLTKLWLLDEITQRAKFPLFIKDNTGTDLFFSTTTWIEGLPSLTKGTTFEGRTWTFKCSQATLNIGSNASASNILNDLVNLATGAIPAIEGLI